MKYSDIAYNYIIDSNGLIYEGRGLYQGAHTYCFNDVSIGVAVLGNFEGQFRHKLCYIAKTYIVHKLEFYFKKQFPVSKL